MIITITDEQRERIKGKRVVASVSGGKDSAALSLWLTEQGIEHDRVFADTGWEHPATYEYLRGPLAEKLGLIIEVSNDKQMVELIKHKGMFPSRVMRWCTEYLKVNPIKAYLKTLEGEVVNAVGIRAAESRARAGLLEWESAKDSPLRVETWRPLIAWSEQDVIDMHKRHGLPPNPLYLSNHSRVGCYPCIFARKEEIKQVAEHLPERIDLIRRLEAEVKELAIARYAKKGWTLESKGYGVPTFFQRGDGSGLMPIDEVVEWSKTARGGKQYELFTSTDEEAGCMRWGLCEQDNKEPEPTR